jgi:glycosyltransferase involved in cell wall biosynthesis
MKIAIDARCLTTPPTGIGHYLLAAVNVCAQLAPDAQWVLMAHRPMHPEVQALLTTSKNVTWIHSESNLYSRNGLLWLICGFAPMARKLGATHVWGAAGMLPRWGMGQMVRLLTVHDLVYKTHAWTMSNKSRLACAALSDASIRHADLLWCVSQFTRSEVNRFFPVRQNRPGVSGSGLNPLRVGASVNPCELMNEVRTRYAVTPRTLLFVGTLEPRKNLSFLLSLMPALAQKGCRLLVVGCQGWGNLSLENILQAPDFPRDQVVFCDYVTDAQLIALYRCVGALVTTSLMEGFGLPLLEAMTEGCPVVAPDLSAMPEVVLDGGVLLAGWDQTQWTDAITHVLEHRQFVGQAAQRAAESHSMTQVCQQWMALMLSNPKSQS